MRNALNRAERYRDLADECRRLAETSLSNQMRNRFSRMAEHYATLAEAEVTRHSSLRRLAVPVMLVKVPRPRLSARCQLRQPNGWRLA